MPNLVPLRCTVCGANLPRETLICEYCGTNFVLSDAEAAKVRNRTTTPSEDDDEAEYISRLSFDLIQEMAIFRPHYRDFGYGMSGRLDDQVDRKIIRYLSETFERKYDAIFAKFEEFRLEQRKLGHAFKSRQIDEDTYDNSRKELLGKFEGVKDQIKSMWDCGVALQEIAKFIEGTLGWDAGGQHIQIQIPDSVRKVSQEGFNDIRKLERVVFYLVDGKMHEDLFVYEIAGFIDCVVKSGVLSTRPSKKHFSVEVDPKNRKMCSFRWEQSESLNVQEYRARPLALPKFS